MAPVIKPEPYFLPALTIAGLLVSTSTGLVTINYIVLKYYAKTRRKNITALQKNPLIDYF
jgi:hypothetical protein